jgi:putative ABC transport system permease protein
LLAGIYPSFHLSSISPLRLLKEDFKRIGGSRRGLQIKNMLVIIQYIISFVALVCTLTILRQFNFIRNSDTGFTRNDILSISLKDPEIRKCPEILINELSGNSRITEITSCSNLPHRITSAGLGYWDGKQPETVLTVFRAGIADNFLDFINLKIISGREFSSDYSSDTARSIIISEKTAKMLFREDAVGKKFGFDPEKPGTIVGIVSDFHFQSLHHTIEPMALVPIGNDDFKEPEYVFVKVIPGALSETKTSVEEKLREISPHYLNPVSVLSDQIDAAYSNDRKLIGIFVFSTILAVVLTCLGQYSLTSYTTKSRTKEMAIRKVLGLHPSGILALLATEMARWIFVSFVIAGPVAHILMTRWLQNFAYHVNIGAGVFMISFLIILLISLTAVIYHIIKLTRVNPAEMIRHE